ncbi:hypothetical protein NB311A_05921 [Nitrobacter sp. Nb-311A]|nr:hypothetical protein NB311A_05921 [Nitrobacter sp. Nb-311A]
MAAVMSSVHFPDWKVNARERWDRSRKAASYLSAGRNDRVRMKSFRVRSHEMGADSYAIPMGATIIR